MCIIIIQTCRKHSSNYCFTEDKHVKSGTCFVCNQLIRTKLISATYSKWKSLVPVENKLSFIIVIVFAENNIRYSSVNILYAKDYIAY